MEMPDLRPPETLVLNGVSFTPSTRPWFVVAQGREFTRAKGSIIACWLDRSRFWPLQRGPFCDTVNQALDHFWKPK
jgi:hypothetical protein